MRLERNQLLAAMRLALLVGTGAGAMPAFAQDTEAQGGVTTELKAVVVTGSRIKRTDLETSQPVFTLSR